VPAAAVIPIPIAYIKFVVVEAFVVSAFPFFLLKADNYFEKIGVFKTDFVRTIKHRIMTYESIVLN